jgi:hypothetical protein
MGDDFIASYVKLAEGEKDPRNLLLAFSIDHVVLVDFDISKHLEVSVTLSTVVQPSSCDYRNRTYTTSCSVTSPSLSGHRQMTLMASRRMT